MGIQQSAVTKAQFQNDFSEMKVALPLAIPPLKAWGENNLGDLSYSLGALILMKLEQELGVVQMDLLLKQVLNAFRTSGITFETFVDLIPSGSGKDFLNES